jgi:hypothetical protein
MNKLNLLIIILYFSLLSLILIVPSLIWKIVKLLININEEIPVYRLLGVETLTINNPTPLIITLVIYLIIVLANVYGVILLYKIIQNFKKFQLFEDDVISFLKQIGYIFILKYLTLYIIKTVINIPDFIILTSNTNNLTSYLENSISDVVIGFFFIVLGNVFEIAKKQKEENELTI